MFFLGLQGPEVKAAFWGVFEPVGLVLTLGQNLFTRVPVECFLLLSPSPLFQPAHGPSVSLTRCFFAECGLLSHVPSPRESGS